MINNTRVTSYLHIAMPVMLEKRKQFKAKGRKELKIFVRPEMIIYQKTEKNE